MAGANSHLSGSAMAMELLTNIEVALGELPYIPLVNIGNFAIASGFSAFSVVAKAICDVTNFP